MFLKTVLPTLFVLVNFAFAQPNSENKQVSAFNPLRENKIDIKHIALDLRFDWQKKQAFGTATITLSTLSPTEKISLDAGFLTINSIISDNKTLKFENLNGDQNDNLKITLDRLYQSSENVTIKIDYRTNYVNEIDPNSLGGNPGKGLRFSKPTSNDPLKPWEIWSIGDPESNRYWFPSFDSPNDLRTTEFTATVDKKLTVISNGKLLNIKDNADGTKTFRYFADTPYQNHQTSFVVGEFVNVKKNFEGIKLNNFGYPNEKDWVDASTERLPDMFRFFSEKTGAKYPYPEFSQAFVQDIGSWTSGANLSTITENMVDDFPTHADYYYLWDLTEAEALASQWFGNYLKPADWREVWLTKSFAHHLNCLYDEHKNGRENWLLWIHSTDQATYFGDWNAGVRRPILPKDGALPDLQTLTNDNYAYFRGALVLNLLRHQLGEENWSKSIRDFVKQFGGKLTTTEDFRKSVEKTTGEKLDWFFDQWIYKMGHPVFEVSKKYENGKLHVFVIQTQSVDKNNQYPQTEFFQGKIDIEIDGKIETVWLKPQTENDFTFNLPNPPKFVNFDFENSWIRELKEEKSLDEWLAVFEGSKDALAKRNAAIELGKIAKDQKTSVEDKAKIINALRAKVLSGEYWRLRNTSLGQLVSLNPNDEATINKILTVIKNEKSWFKASAVAFLGNTKKPEFTDIYLNALNDESFRVINNAAVALGKTKDKRAFEALAKLAEKPSMKSQTMLSALAGLKELGDPRGFDIAYKALENLQLPRWRLPTVSVWDYRVLAVDTIVSLGRSEAAFPLIFERFKKSMAENDLEGIFYNTVLLAKLKDDRGQTAFEMLKTKYKDDANAMAAVNQYEAQFKESTKK